MTSHTVTADMLALDAASAGEHLWRAIELTPTLKPSRAVLTFQCALEQIIDEMECHYAAKLFMTTAMQAVGTMVDAKERTRLTNAAHDAWTEYVQFLRAEHAAEEADYRADCARDERLMGAA